MKGGVIQLLSNNGKEDQYIVKNPHITLFKNIYRRHTNFSKSDILLKSKSPLDFGKKSMFKIERLGDLLNSLILQIELPEVILRYRNITYRELNEYLYDVNIIDRFTDSNTNVTNEDLLTIIEELTDEVNYLLNLNLVYKTIIDEINIINSYYFVNVDRDTIYYDDYLLNYLVEKYDSNKIQLKFINAMINDSINKEHDGNSLLNMTNFITKLSNNYKEQMIGNSSDGEQLIINLISTIKYNNIYDFTNNNMDASTFFYETTKNKYNTYNQQTNFEDTEISYYLSNYFINNNRKILKSYDINIIKDKLITHLFWNYYDSSNIYLNIYASLKEDYKFIFYKNNTELIRNISLINTDINDKFINTSKILPNDLKIDYFKNKLTTGLKIFFPNAKSLDINVDINTIDLFYREYLDREINKYHYNNLEYLKNSIISDYLEYEILTTKLSLKVSDYLPINNNDADNIKLRNKLNNCYLLNLLYLGLAENLKITILNFMDNIYVEHMDLYDNLESLLDDAVTTINGKLMESDNNNYNKLLSKSDIDYLSNLYDNRKENNENMETSDKIVTYIFKKESKIEYDGVYYNIFDYILLILNESITEALDDYGFSGEDLDNEEFMNNLNKLFDTYKRDIDLLPSNSIYISNNNNLSNCYNLNLTYESYNNNYDVYSSILNYINKNLINNYNNFYYNKALNNDLLKNIKFSEQNNKINDLFLNDYVNKDNNNNVLNINYYSLTNEKLNEIIITDQIVFPFMNTENTIDNFWIMRNEIFLLLNILHLNLLKIEDLNFSKKDHEFLNFEDLYKSVMKRLIINEETYALFNSYVNGEYNDPPFNGGTYDKNVVTQWFKIEYAHYLNDNYINLTENNPEFHKVSKNKFKITSTNLIEYYQDGVMDVINRLKEDFSNLITCVINNETITTFYNNLNYNNINNYTRDKLIKLSELFDELNTMDKSLLNEELEKFNNIVNFTTINLYGDIDIITSKYNYFNKSTDIYNFIKDKIISRSFLLSLNTTQYFNLKEKDPEYINKLLIDNYYKKINDSNEIINKIHGDDGDGGLKEQLHKLSNIGKNANFSWVDSIGHYIIKSVGIYLNDQLIDKFTGEWIHLNSLLFGDKHKSASYARMIGHTSELISYNNIKKPSRTLYIPLPFWFFKYPNQSLPLIALQYSELNIEVELRDLDECCNYEFLTKFNRKPKLKCNLLAGFIYLDEKERSSIVNSKNEYLIEQLQYKDSIIITKKDIINNNIVEIDFKLNNCVKYLVWTFQPIKYRTSNYELKKLNNYLLSEEEINTNFNLINTDNINLTNVKKYSEEYNNMLLNNSEKYKEYPFFEELKILFDGIIREAYKGSNYYNYVQPSQYFKSSAEGGIYVYSFCMLPKTNQPSGTANLGLIDKVSFNMKLSNKAIELLNNDENIRFSIYAITYNNLRIMSGIGGLAFYK
jgi:hypothetical protein